METKNLWSLVAVVWLLSGCGSVAAWVPLEAQPAPADLTLVWVGRGECERMENGAWVRRPEYDYDFSVEQRRGAGRWDSVKSMRRLHPGYDGLAGERTQTYFFRQEFGAPDASGKVAGALRSTLGTGTVMADAEFRKAELEFLAANVSTMAPYDRYRITQRYDYEGGQLEEVVELNKGQQPWVRNREKALLFAARRFEGPPTVAR
jgi:hypothetical protein